jgi:hypothetical protein
MEVLISKASDPNKMRVRITGKFDNGYIGFGIAKPGGSALAQEKQLNRHCNVSQQ